MDEHNISGTGEIIAGLALLLDHLTNDRSLASAADRLVLLEEALTVADRVQSLVFDLAAEASNSDAAMVAHGTSLRTWIADRCRYTARQAGALIHQAGARSRYPQVCTAGRTGEVNTHQAAAIVRSLDRLPDELSAAQVSAGEASLVEQAAILDSDGLSVLGNRLADLVAPEVADELDRKALERQTREAERNRHLTFTSDGAGSVLIRGQLPTLTAVPLIRIIDAYTETFRRNALDRLDPLTETLTPGMRRADTLIALVSQHAEQQLAPSVGGDRPRVVVTIAYDQLLADCTKARSIDGTTRLTPGQLRRLVCDADLLPVVLGGTSEILDVGRDHRLVTPPIRLALTLRDKGCAFPGCDTPPAACHAHHLTPWWAGGHTALHNLVLVCPHHHALVEPGHDPGADRWKIRLDQNGIPKAIPPRRVDPTRQPRQHQRYKLE
jgi:hypothetical protein